MNHTIKSWTSGLGIAFILPFLLPFLLQSKTASAGFLPETLLDDHAVKKFVSTNANAIGYIDAKEVDSSVKVLFSEKE